MEEVRSFDEEFETIYRGVCENCQNNLNEKRKKINQFLLSIFLVLITLNIIIYFILNTKYYLVGIIALSFCIMLFLVIQGNEIYKKFYKNNVINALVKAYNPNLYYEPKIGISKSDYTMSNFDNSFNEFFSEDQIYGTLDNGTSIRVAEVSTAITCVTKKEDGTTQTDRVETYRGMYGVVKMPFNINSNIDIYNDSITNRYNDNRIEVDSAEFEKYYDCFSTQKVDTLRIFTSDLIEKFNEVRRNSKYGFELKIKNNMIYFRYKCGQLFEPPTLKNGLNKELIKKYYKFIYFPLEVIVKLSSNINDISLQK